MKPPSEGRGARACSGRSTGRLDMIRGPTASGCDASTLGGKAIVLDLVGLLGRPYGAAATGSTVTAVAGQGAEGARSKSTTLADALIVRRTVRG